MVADHGYVPFNFTLTDERGNSHYANTSNLSSVRILTANTDQLATVYADSRANTSLTNPITSFTEGPQFKFFGSGGAYDVEVVTSSGATVRHTLYSSGSNQLYVPQSLFGIAGLPTVNASLDGTCTLLHYPLGGDRVLTKAILDDVVVDLSLTATNAIAYGGSKLWDWPVGVIAFHDGEFRLKLAIANDQSQYFNDATPEGDVALGTTEADSAEALGSSDTSDDDIIDAAAYTFADYTDTLIAGVRSTAPAIQDGSSAALDCYLNLTADAGELANTTGPEVQASGIATVTWGFRPAHD